MMASDGQGGRLVYVMGPSGAGKDSILHYAALRLAADVRFSFPRRWITRPADSGGENHISLSVAAFAARAAAGDFALAWEANGHHYGIDTGIDAALAAGRHVVVNGSRGYLPLARRRYPDLLPVAIAVSADTLDARLRARGRETVDQIAARLARATALDGAEPGICRISNDGGLAEAGEAFLALLRRLPGKTAAVSSPG